MHRLLMLAGTPLLLASCGPGDQGPQNDRTAVETQPQGETGTRVENLPPSDEGYAIVRRRGFLANAPAVTVDGAHGGQDGTDLAAYVRAAAQALTSAETEALGARLSGSYPRVWLNEVTQYENAGAVATLARTPRQGFSYLPARLVMKSSGTGAAESRDPNSTNGGRLITIRKYHLEWWRSPNAVTRSCAVNTMAHEITHNMTRAPDVFRWAFTDTGLGGSVTSEKGSYMMGALAQCRYLQSVGRIGAGDVAQCVAVWGLEDVFNSGRCDDFNDTEPVKWPRDPRP